MRAAQPVGLDVDLALALDDRGAEPGKTPVMEVQIAAAEVAASDFLEHRLAETVQQRRHEEHRAAELPG